VVYLKEMMRDMPAEELVAALDAEETSQLGRTRHEVAFVAPRLLSLVLYRALKVDALHTHSRGGLLSHSARERHVSAVSVSSVKEPGQLVSPWRHTYSLSMLGK